MTTVVAVADRAGARVGRLLWNLARHRPADPLRVVVVDRAGDPGLPDRLRPWASQFPWAVVKPGGDKTLGDFAPEGPVVTLPADAVPVGDAVGQLLRAGANTAVGTLLDAGPLTQYGLDPYGTNLSADLVADCLPCPWPAAGPRVEEQRDWRRPAERERGMSLVPEARFIMTQPRDPSRVHFCPRPSDPVTLVEESR